MKTIVYFYSHKNSNRFLANKISKDLNCEIEEIKPRLNAHLLMLMGINFGNKKLKSDCSNYERVFLVGPIWMGKLIVPLKNFIRKNGNKIQNLVFVTCCGSPYDKKDEKFGHNLVFKELKKRMGGDRQVQCKAFPINLALPEDQKNDSDAFMKCHLNSTNFNGEIESIYNVFIQDVQKVG